MSEVHAPLATAARVLLIRLSAMGDVVFALETLASMQAERPDVRADFLVDDRFAALLQGHPQLDRTIVLPRRRRTGIPAALRRLRQRRYDAVLDLHGVLKSALPARLARAGRRIGFAPPVALEGSHRLYDRAVPVPPGVHKAERGYLLLRALGLQGRPAAPALPWSRGPIATDVVLHPGTSAAAAIKRWPLRSWEDLVRRLVPRGVQVTVTIGPGEEAIAEALQRAAGRPLEVERGPLPDLARALGSARVVVAADTGPLHLAVALGTPAVALFGPKAPDVYGPRGAGHRVLFHDVPCRPCRRRTCPSPACVLGIGVDEVESAVLARLAQRPDAVGSGGSR